MLVGLTLAVAQFGDLHRLAGTVLASTAIVAAVVGFASRQVLANAIAGVVLAVTQPLRLGDVVTVDGQTGVVEDITLTYTWLRSGSDARIVVPERAAGAVHAAQRLDPLAHRRARGDRVPRPDGRRGRRAARDRGDRARHVGARRRRRRVRARSSCWSPASPSHRPSALRREADLRGAVLAALRAAGVPRAGMDPA